jgi:transcriptional regulator with XRE-family HTH domain
MHNARSEGTHVGSGDAQDLDQAVLSAVGEELRRARTAAGLSRADVAAHMQDILPRTIGSYEQGARNCSAVALTEICEVIGVSAVDLLAMAHQRSGLDLDIISLRVDLAALATAPEPPQLLRDWAAKRLAASPRCPVAVVTPAILDELALFFDCPREALLATLAAHIPPSTPRQVLAM